MRPSIRMLSLGALAAVFLGAAWLTDVRLAPQRCINAVTGLTAHNDRGEPLGITVGDTFAERHPQGQWRVEPVVDGDHVVFQAPDNATDVVWHCTPERLPFIAAVSEEAVRLTPRNLTVEQRRVRARNDSRGSDGGL